MSKTTVRVCVVRGQVWLGGEVRQTGDTLSLPLLEALEAVESARAKLLDKDDMAALREARHREVRLQLIEARRTPSEPALDPRWQPMQ